MLLRNYKEVNSEPYQAEGAQGVKIRWLITEKEGAPTFAMRVIQIEPGGYTSPHKHDWEHEVFIKQGEGTLACEGKEFPLKTDDVLFIPPEELHQFKNTSNKSLEFICLVPHKGC